MEKAMDQDSVPNEHQPPVAEPETAREPDSIGGRLRAARLAQGRSIAELTAMTKVPARTLEAIEQMDLTALPAGPYATGFVRTYARALGLDAEAAVAEMRSTIQSRNIGQVSVLTQYEPADPARVPPTKLVLISLAIVAVIAIAYGVWRSEILNAVPTVAAADAPATTGTESVAATPAPAALPEPTVTIAPDAPVLISASDQLYFALEDANGRSQFDLTLNAGEFYTVKPNQRDLFLRTSKPQALKLVVGGQALPPIGSPDTVLSGVGLDAASLSRIASGQWTPAAAPATAAPATAAPTAARP